MARFDLFETLRNAADGQAHKAAGIDLGTTNSAIATASIDEHGEITIACLRDGEEGDPSAPIAAPSVVALDGERIVVGREARHLLAARVESAQGKTVFAETKNEIGLRYSYWKAPPGLNVATAVATHVLRHLVATHSDELMLTEDPLVIGVPAAFHGTQRTATLEAAANGAGEWTRALIDEPVAAFIDLLHTSKDEALQSVRRLLVFDFGGGTCDVALFDLDLTTTPARIVLRGTSRYHRLGGGDIDRAIVHEVLLPQLLAQNRVQSLDLTWRQKKRDIESRLLLSAEGLKHALCRRVQRAIDEGKVLPADTEMVDTRSHRIECGGRTMYLENATLTLADFERVLAPFLDDAARVAAPNEYFSALSIFEPVASLVDRLRVDPASIDAVLFAGGATLVPQVRTAVLKRFPNAKPLGGTDPEHLQGAVARGAALQALSLAVTSQPLLKPVAGIDLSIRTDDGLVALIAEGEALPITDRRVPLAAPRDSARALEISVELVGDAHRTLFRQAWTLPGPVRRGEPLHLALHVDENQSIKLSLVRAAGEAEDFRRTITSPLAHVDNLHKVQARVLEREERIRRGEIDDADRGVEHRRLAEDYAELRHYEKAIDAMRVAMRNGEDGPGPINLIGIWYGRLRDKEREESCYRSALEYGEWSTALFNLALTRRDRGDLHEALACADRAIAAAPDEPCYLVLKSDIARKRGDTATADRLAREALEASNADNLESRSDWALEWLDSAAKSIKDANWQVKLKLERERRKQKPQEPRVGVLPAQATPHPHSAQRVA
jgi:molecular chaperone DnaK